MKVLRYLAAILLIIAGLVHFYIATNPPPEFKPAIMVIFGLLYVVTGVLILMKKRIGLFLGLIPIVPIAMTPMMIDFQNLDWTFAMFPVELIAVICCLILIFKKEK